MKNTTTSRLPLSVVVINQHQLDLILPRLLKNIMAFITLKAGLHQAEARPRYSRHCVGTCLAKQRRKCFRYGKLLFLFWLLTLIDDPERSVERAWSGKCENHWSDGAGGSGAAWWPSGAMSGAGQFPIERGAAFVAAPLRSHALVQTSISLSLLNKAKYSETTNTT